MQSVIEQKLALAAYATEHDLAQLPAHAPIGPCQQSCSCSFSCGGDHIHISGCCISVSGTVLHLHVDQELFSLAGDVYDEKKSRLTPERAETLHFIKSNCSVLDTSADVDLSVYVHSLSYSILYYSLSCHDLLPCVCVQSLTSALCVLHTLKIFNMGKLDRFRL